MTEKYHNIINNFIVWGSSADHLYAALAVGSQIRKIHPADEYSDLDIIMVVEDPNYYISNDDWLNEIDSFFISFTQDTIDDEKERRVLFNNAADVDFVLLPEYRLDALLNNSETSKLLNSGFEMLIDKIGLFKRIEAPSSKEHPHRFYPETDFVNLVSDFWYHTVWTAKKLKRGEIWSALSCLDCYMKQKLLSVIETYGKAFHGEAYNTWHNGRFIEEWAEEWIVERLYSCFSHYTYEDLKSALFCTMSLFRDISLAISDKLCIDYPKQADDYATSWVTSAL